MHRHSRPSSRSHIRRRRLRFATLLVVLAATASTPSSVAAQVVEPDKGGGIVPGPIMVEQTVDAFAGVIELVLSPGPSSVLSYRSNSQRIRADLEADRVFGRLEFTDSYDIIPGFNHIIGSDFDDNLFGNEAHNVLDGGFEDDLLDGRGGDDTILWGFGNDQYRGGEGFDTLDLSQFEPSARTADVEVSINPSPWFTVAVFDVIDASGTVTAMQEYWTPNSVDGPAEENALALDIERIVGTNYDDVVRARSQLQVLELGGGNDRVVRFNDCPCPDALAIATGPGDDLYYLNDWEESVNTIELGDGADIFYLNGNSEVTVSGGTGNDSFTLRSAGDVFATGGQGDDVFYDISRQGAKVLSGGQDDDTFLVTGTGNPLMAPDVWISGGPGSDTVHLIYGIPINGGYTLPNTPVVIEDFEQGFDRIGLGSVTSDPRNEGLTEGFNDLAISYDPVTDETTILFEVFVDIPGAYPSQTRIILSGLNHDATPMQPSDFLFDTVASTNGASGLEQGSVQLSLTPIR